MDNWKDHQKAHIQEAIDTHCHQHHHLDKYTHLLNMDNDSHNCHSSKVCRSLFVDIHLCHFRQDTSWTLAHKIQGNGLHIQAHKGLLGYIFHLLGIPKTTKKFDAEALPSFDDFTLVSTGPLQIISSFLQWRGQNPLHFFLGFDGLLYFFLMQSSLIHCIGHHLVKASCIKARIFCSLGHSILGKYLRQRRQSQIKSKVEGFEAW